MLGSYSLNQPECPYYGGPMIHRGPAGGGFGRRQGMGNMGIDIRETIATVGQAQKTAQEIMPSVEIMAKDYERLSPKINFLMDYWPITLAVLFLTITGGAFAGSYWVMRKARK